jgi:hypothetical protein
LSREGKKKTRNHDFSLDSLDCRTQVCGMRSIFICIRMYMYMYIHIFFPKPRLFVGLSRLQNAGMWDAQHFYMYTYVYVYVHTYFFFETTTFRWTLSTAERRYVGCAVFFYMYTYVYVYVHTYIHTYIHTYKHTYIHTYICRYR